METRRLLSNNLLRLLLAAAMIVIGSSLAARAEERATTLVQGEARAPSGEADLRAWLQNMVWHHRFSLAEIEAAIGYPQDVLQQALAHYRITPRDGPPRAADAPLLVLPYPGGRHPRLGFLDGAVRPQRETKISVFLPWDPRSYVVVDVPEAIWSNLGLLYLAHTHVPTIWTEQNIELEPLEWRPQSDGALTIERILPNKVAFGATIHPEREAVHMELWLRNGLDQPLDDLRVQNCVMLGHTAGFEQQTNDNKVFRAPYAAVRSDDGQRWIITAWQHGQRTWANEQCPCLHSDPLFPNCRPGETEHLRGWLSFYEGENIQAEFNRIEQTGWRRPATMKPRHRHPAH